MDDGIAWLTVLETAMVIGCLAVSSWLRPWRMLHGPLLTPTLAALVVLPGFWLLPQHLPPGLSVQLSGASLLVLMLGWPLAVPVLTLVALIVWSLGHADASAVLSQLVWVGLVPATLALGIGAAMRRWLPAQVFIYTLGRGFFGTALAMFLSGVLYEVIYRLFGDVPLHDALVARWLMAWGDAFLTGLLTAVFVAFVPQWLATWSDARYLQPPGPPSGR